MWLLRFLSVGAAEVVASIGVDALVRLRMDVNSLTISDSPISPPLEPEEVEVTWLLALRLDTMPLEPRLSEEEDTPRLRVLFFLLPLSFGWPRFGDAT